MASKLILRQYIDLPFHPEGDFDHGDVALSTGSVFIANTAAGTVEVVDGQHLRHQVTLPGCPEASGVLVWHGRRAWSLRLPAVQASSW